MSTVRETYGLACPRCRRDDHLQIWAFTMVGLTPNGSVEVDHSHEWFASHHCECRNCSFQAQVADFTVPDGGMS